MKRYLLLTVLAMAGAVPLSAQTDAIQQWCETGGVQVATQGLKSTTTVQQSYPRCRVTVFYTGTTTLATIYKDKLNTPLANPFTANSDGSWLFFALDGQGYDVTMDMGTAPNVFLLPFTLTDLKVGTGGGGGQTILQFNGVPTTPASPVNFIDTASCTWNLTGNVAGVSCSGGGSGSTPAWPIFFYPLTQSVNNQIFVGHPIGGANITVPSSCPGSKALTYASTTVGSAPVATGTSAWTFQDFTTSTTLCTFTWSASGSVAVVTGSGGVIAAGDSVGFVGAATPDATLANVGAVINGTVSGGGSGGGPSLLTNGVLNSSQTLLNIINGSFNGVTLGFSNTSGGVVQPIFTGTLNNAGITNPTMTINGVTCTLGGSCTVGGGGGSPGGTSGQIQYNNSGSFGGFTVSGDLAINTSTGLSTVSSSAGVPFGTLAFANAATPPPWGTTTPNTGAFSTMKIGSLNGCLTATSGVISAAGSCGSSPIWSALGNPAGNLALTMGANTTTLTFNATTGSGVDLFKLTDTASNTGTGALMHLTTASGSAAKPWQADANGKGFYIDPATGAMTGTGFGSVAGQFGLPAGTYAGGTAGYAVFTSDATSGFAEVDENNTGRSRICTAANSICGGSSFPFTIIQEDQANSNGNVGSYTLTFPNALQASGATAWIVMAADGSASVGTPAGWTVDVNQTQAINARLLVLHKTSAGDTTAVFTGSATNFSALFFELSGTRTLDQSSPTGVVQNNYVALPSITPTAGSLVVGAASFVADTSNETWGAPAAWLPTFSINPSWTPFGTASKALNGARWLTGFIATSGATGSAISPPAINIQNASLFGGDGVAIATFSIK